MAVMAAVNSPLVGCSLKAKPHWNDPGDVSMIHVGSSGGTLDLVPTSSSIMNRTYSIFSLLADGLPAVRRSMTNEPVLMYQASPSLRLCVGRKAGKVATGAPSAWYFTSPPEWRGVCRTIKAVSPAGASLTK